MSIYKTPDEYLEPIIERIVQTGGRLTDFHEGSGARTLAEMPAVALSEQSLVAEQLRLDSYLATATGDALTDKAADRGVARKAAVAATGTIQLSRQDVTAAVSVPAGWSSLATVPTPGVQTVSVQTTTDAVFAIGVASVTVPGVATEGGKDGNLTVNTKLLPVNPLPGFQTDGGFKAQTAFTGGVDEESDDALRARVPIEVQGRIKGRREAFLAAALAVAGVESSKVLRAGELRTNGTAVAAGQVEVYYEGIAGLLATVQAAAEGAALLGQGVTALTAASRRAIASLTVFVNPGVDTAIVAAAVRAAVRAIVNAAGVGVKVYASDVVRAVHDVPDVVSVNVPFADLRLFTATAGTFGNLTPGSTEYLKLDDADVTVAVTVLT